MSPSIFQLRQATGHPIKWPTYLTITVDAILNEADQNAPANTKRVTFQAEGGDFFEGTVIAREEDLDEAVFIFANVSVATNPLQLYVPHEHCARLVPEDFDGSDPQSAVLPWACPLLNGIGVVARLNRERTHARICGLSSFGARNINKRYDVDVGFEGKSAHCPTTGIPPLWSLVSFDAALVSIDGNHVPQARLLRIVQLQVANSLLLAELNMVRDEAGELRARLENDRREKDQEQINGAGDGQKTYL
ncbi:hypothetical protein OC835_004562 [Tilletia horrida]|nr:hypothetical protein OC835_004562 [Tilletia horrida]KAK0563954.1 hypothetical protein OC844_001950 [Tilletia horrida]